ncbi:hypothetical protein M378DRAFT_1034420 [Amanita muscaria Koide BX008]|uniref:Uncharacterized protein n=1 Tax=Amanita muscaria (strain Koide BX008) TaxID=946122 RepID=A0A0C2SRG9_AMAMK|nr:hypothetical protein M378DRAFT_1034420 [Amanita muscaria Koide BX008]
MPGGFNVSAIKSYLAKKAWGLGSSRSDGVLLLATTHEPPQCLASDAEAKTWLDSVVSVYAQRSGISLATAGSGGLRSSAAGGAVINSEEFLKFQAEQHQFAAQHVELYMRYLGRDSRAGEIAYDKEKASSNALQVRLGEHGDAYIDGIQPKFDALKARRFDSSWNWVRQDALAMYYDIIFGRLQTVDLEITARCIALMNRADDHTLRKGETYKLAKEFGQQLIDNIKEVLGHPPVYMDVTFPTAVTEKEDIIYSEVVREGVRKREAHVEEMASGDTASGTVNIQKSRMTFSNYEPRACLPRDRRPQVSAVTSWEYSSNLTGVYLDILHEIATSGTTFKDKNALLTGCGKGSIGVKVLKRPSCLRRLLPPPVTV